MGTSIRRNALRLIAGAGFIGAIAVAPSAAAFETGVMTTAPFFTGSEQSKNLWWNRLADTGAQTVRVNVRWRVIAPASRPANPRDHTIYNWNNLDSEVLRASARGLRVMFTVYQAPDWAEGPGRPSDGRVDPGGWKPNPVDLGHFAHALATRYNGTQVNAAGYRLPRVRFFEVWNEPNLTLFLAPQWNNGKNLIGDDRYRDLLNSFYAAAKAVRPDNVIIAAGTAPFGENVGTGPFPQEGGRTRPLQFYRELMCLKRTKNRKASCPVKAKFDIAAHHPINRSGKPRQSARHRDDMTTPDVKNLTKALRYAEKKRTILPSRRGRDIWATEIWIETNPPDKGDGLPLGKAAAAMAETLYLQWKQKVDVVINLHMEDYPFASNDPSGAKRSIQAGFWFHQSVRNGKQKKPLFKAFKFPFVSERKSKKKLTAWGLAPASGKLKIERKRGKKWKKVKTLRARKGKTFKTNLKLKGKQKLRAKVGRERSNVWKQKK